MTDDAPWTPPQEDSARVPRAPETVISLQWRAEKAAFIRQYSLRYRARRWAISLLYGLFFGLVGVSLVAVDSAVSAEPSV